MRGPASGPGRSGGRRPVAGFPQSLGQDGPRQITSAYTRNPGNSVLPRYGHTAAVYGGCHDATMPPGALAHSAMFTSSESCCLRVGFHEAQALAKVLKRLSWFTPRQEQGWPADV